MTFLISVILFLGGIYLRINPETFNGAGTVGFWALLIGAVVLAFRMLLILLATLFTGAAAAASKPPTRKYSGRTTHGRRLR